MHRHFEHAHCCQLRPAIRQLLFQDSQIDMLDKLLPPPPPALVLRAFEPTRSNGPVSEHGSFAQAGDTCRCNSPRKRS